MSLEALVPRVACLAVRRDPESARPLTRLAEETLPVSLREGVRILRERHCPNAQVAAVDANFALIDLGEAQPPDGYVESSVRVFARMSLDIRNVKPYGVVTIPMLHRKDGAAIGHQHLSHPSALPVAEPGGAAPALWSWKWDALSQRGPEDVALAYEWAWKCLRDGAN
jgi:hypothetical protein